MDPQREEEGETANPEVETDISRSRLFEKYKETREIPCEERRMIRKIQETKKAKEVIAKTNKEVREILRTQQEWNMWEINSLLYAAAITISDELNGEIPTNRTARKQTTPPWQKRLESKVADMRKELSTIVNFKNRNTSHGPLRVPERVAQTLRAYTAEGEDPNFDNVVEQLKQRIAATSQRLRRYKKRTAQFRQNRNFKTNAKGFYRNIKEEKTEAGAIPSRENIDAYWRNIYETPVRHNEDAAWIRSFKSNYQMEWTPVEDAEVTKVIKNLANWKAPGPDRIQSFWFKRITSVHKPLAAEYRKMLEGADFPPWLAKGITYLIAKNRNTDNPKNYRPITCLNIMYKIYTAIMSDKTYEFLESSELLPTEQKGCRRGARGCVDQLLISKMVIEDCKKNKKDLSIAWVDYQKAFDSMPHSWILKAMEMVGVHENIIEATRRMMQHWTTHIELKSGGEAIKTDVIKILRGIFQGDSFSPLLFCIGLIPLSHKLNEQRAGYDLQEGTKQLTHLLYMDDLKCFAASDKKQERQLKLVKEFSDDINMKFGLDKCAKVTLRQGKVVKTENIEIDLDSNIRELEYEEPYKYLGIEEGDGFHHKAMKEKVRKEYVRRVRAILKTELTAKNKFTAIGAFAVPVLQYGFGILNWRLAEIKALDVKTRKYLTMYKMHHPSADKDRIYVSRKKGGRGLRQIEAAYKTTMISTKYYLKDKVSEDPFLKAVYRADLKLPPSESIAKEAKKYEDELTSDFSRASVKERPTKIKNRVSNEIRRTWKEKPMHGQYPRLMDEETVAKDWSTLWLSSGELKGETESLIVAAQDQALNTRYRQKRIHGTRIDGRCRLCHEFDETIDHVVAGCPVLAKKEYIERHDRVGTQVHFQLCKELGVKVGTEKWYQHQPERVMNSEDGKVTIIWDTQVRTDRNVGSNRPDIIVKQRGKETLLIDIAVPMDRNVNDKIGEKLLKYKSLDIEVKRMWNTKSRVIPVVIGATGIVTKESRLHLKTLPCQVSITSLQKTALIGTASILRKVIT